jgi:hypothetical protein
MRHIPRTTAVLAALLAAGIALSGCSAGSSGAADEGGASSQYDAPQAVDGEAAAPDEAAAPEEQSLVVTGRVAITADDPIAAAEQATAIALEAGGRIDSRAETAAKDDGGATATLTMRIPADEVEHVRGRLTELGTVDTAAFDSVDVGGRARDLDARITTLRTSIARYTQWLGAADTTADLIALESEIASRQTQLESLEAEQRQLADQVAMSTITVELYSAALAPPPEGPTSFWEGLVAGWTAFVGFWAGVAVALGVALPWLVLLGLVLVVVVLLARRAGRAVPAAAATASGDPTAS